MVVSYVEEQPGEKGEEIEDEKGNEYRPHSLLQEGDEGFVLEKGTRQDEEDGADENQVAPVGVDGVFPHDAHDGKTFEQVPDETFASGVLGQGFAVRPSKPCVYAPFDGTVIQTMDTKHAVGFQSEDGMEVLIHVGIDTVDMNGEGFDLKCKEGDEIKRGQLLLSFDPEAIRKAGHPDITVVAVTNSFDYTSVNVEKTGTASAMDKVLTVTKE